MLAAADQSLEALLASDSGSNQAPSVPDTSATEDEGGNGRGGAAALQGLRLDPAYSDSSLSSSRSSSAGGGGGGGSSKGGSRMGGGHKTAKKGRVRAKELQTDFRLQAQDTRHQLVEIKVRQ